MEKAAILRFDESKYKIIKADEKYESIVASTSFCQLWCCIFCEVIAIVFLMLT